MWMILAMISTVCIGVSTVLSKVGIKQADAYVTNGTKPETEKQLVPCVAITAENVEFLNAFVYTGE